MILKKLPRYAIPMIFVVAIILILSPEPPLSCEDDSGECYEGEVLKIINGDTIKTSTQNTVRLSLVSAPEISEEGGIEAREFIERICPVGSKIIVDEDDRQQMSFNVTLAQVYCNGKSLNASLVENDHGAIDERFCNDSEFNQESWASFCNAESGNSVNK